jgi:hypothetical protein
MGCDEEDDDDTQGGNGSHILQGNGGVKPILRIVRILGSAGRHDSGSAPQ